MKYLQKNCVSHLHTFNQLYHKLIHKDIYMFEYALGMGERGGTWGGEGEYACLATVIPLGVFVFVLLFKCENPGVCDYSTVQQIDILYLGTVQLQYYLFLKLSILSVNWKIWVL